MKDREGQTIRAAEQLTIPFEEAGDPRDIPPLQTPRFTSAVDELLLNQILADIARRHIHKVGIIATDPLDVVFLARLVRKACPDAQLFTTQPHLIYTHPQVVADLRGMIVASTYPLYPENQLWSYPFRRDRNLFSCEDVHGVYNAAVAHMDKLGDSSIPPHFLEYGFPFDPTGARQPRGGAVEARAPRMPPIWLSIIGSHGLFPLKSAEADHQRARDYVYPHRQRDEEEGSILESFPELADITQLGRRWYWPEFPRFWAFLFMALSAACVGMAGVNLLAYRWSAGARIGSCERPEFAPFRDLAEFLNCCSARDARASRPGGADLRGPAGYLVLASSIVLVVYLTLAWPLLRVARASWKAGHWPGGANAWMVLLACLAISGLVASLLWPLAGRISGRPGGHPRLAGLVVRNTLAAASATLGVFLVAWIEIALNHRPLGAAQPGVASLTDRDAIFRLARSVAIPSGISPILTMIFLGIAGLAWAYAQLKRRFVLANCTPSNPIPPSGRPESWDDRTLARMAQHLGRFEATLASPFRSIAGAHPVVVVAVLAAFIHYLLPVFHHHFLRPISSLLWHLVWKSSDRSGVEAARGWFDYAAVVLFFALFFALWFHLAQLIVLWRDLRRVMMFAVRLPLARALDRIPPRVTRWLKEAPSTKGDRFDLIRRQASVLSGLCGAADERVHARVAREVSDADWDELREDLGKLSHGNVARVCHRLRDILLDHWKGQPLAEIYPEPVAGPRPASTTEPGQAWARDAEDLLVLIFLRWLSSALAQVWILIGFLVAGSISLLLAINAYPFPYQDRITFALGVLISALVVLILVIVLGFNRDELVSRISNTAPNRFTLDQHLLGAITAYIIPLVGVFAALSLDTSDTLRSLLDPILRHLR